MSVTLPPGVTIAKPPPELKLGDEDDYDAWRLDYRRNLDEDRRDPLQEAAAFPVRVEASTPEVLMGKLFGCSGSVDSTRYLEATKLRTMPDMGWEEARVALNRLLADVAAYSRRYRTTTRDYVALAEFTLTAAASEPFTGRKGDHAVKLRSELGDAIGRLQRHLQSALHTSTNNARVLDRPITDRLPHTEHWHRNAALWTMVPTAADRWTRIIEATPEQAMAALDFLRAVLATWNAQRPFAAGVAERMETSALPTAAEYAEAVHIAEMLAFANEKLDALYAGIMHSMPIYRMHPATSEREAIELWWPWGRDVPLIDGGPARPPPARKAVLDPSTITATRPTDVVKQVIEQTGINRTTAQRLTANLRRDLRRKREAQALGMLVEGATRAAVAKAVGLSASRISSMFKGRIFPTKRAARSRPDPGVVVGAPCPLLKSRRRDGTETAG